MRKEFHKGQIDQRQCVANITEEASQHGMEIISQHMEIHNYLLSQTRISAVTVVMLLIHAHVPFVGNNSIYKAFVDYKAT